nr:hypothetical protein GCM10020093_079010 [Planobispora longispora]
MVQGEQVVEVVGVGRPALHVVQQGELAVEQALLAAGQVDEDLADAAAQVGLADGGLDRGAPHRAERPGHVADLRRAALLDERRLGLDVDLLTAPEPLDQAREPYVREIERGGAQPGQLVRQAAAETHRDDDRGDHGDQADAGRHRDPDHDAGGQRPGLLRQPPGGLGGELVEPGGQRVRGLPPLLGLDGQPVAGPRDDGLLHRGETLEVGELKVCRYGPPRAASSADRARSWRKARFAA